MLTADLVDVRRSGGGLLLRPLDARGREEALALAAAYLEAARAHVGARREELSAAWDAAAGEDGGPRRRKLVLGLRKLVEDACTFEAETTIAPAELRRALFVRAARARRERDAGEPMEREAVLVEVAREVGLDPASLERGLFADLRSEHLLREAPSLGAPALVEAYELGQAQAVLLAAVRVTCEVRSASPGPLRAFFAKLKFLQLLFSAERLDEGAFRVVIDGPFSMFESVTRYGLRLALVLPALRELDDWSLVADVRWGKERTPLVFRLDASEAGGGQRTRATADREDLHLSDDARALLEGLRALGATSAFRVEPAGTFLDLPGVGLCVPDLVLTRDDGARVYVEVLGFWSRDAVFRRVELARQGLGEPIVFVASSRLRVSAELLGEEESAALHVYKGKISPRSVLDRVAKLAERAPPRAPHVVKKRVRRGP